MHGAGPQLLKRFVRSALLAMCLGLLALGGVQAQKESKMSQKVLTQQVRDAELAFAATMAKRDFAAFRGFIAEEAVFYSGKKALHGRAEVLAAWKPYFDGAQAPFSWKPDQVEITTGGLIALSSGPVHSPQGKLLGRFNTIWHQEAPGVWRVVFDRGDTP